MRPPFRILFFVLLLCGSFFSCTKTVAPIYNNSVANIDTVFPGSYFPAYPGSWWAYNTGDSIIMENIYHSHIFNTIFYRNGPPQYDTLILPRFKPNALYVGGDTFVYVNKYGFSVPLNTTELPGFIPILSENLNDHFTLSPIWTGNQSLGLTVTKDTSIIVNSVTYDSVIVCIHYNSYWLSSGYSPLQSWDTREYFGKHVGLLKRESRNFPVDTTVVTNCYLTNYFINH